MPCTMSEDQTLAKQVRLQVVRFERRVFHVVFDIQKVSPKTETENMNFLCGCKCFHMIYASSVYTG